MVIVIMGVSGAGKTTIGSLLADQLGWSFCDADDYHSEANKEKMARGDALTDEDRAGWLADLRELISREIGASRNIVLACSALKESYRERLQVSNQVRFVHLRGTIAQIEERMRLRRDHFMKPGMLQSQFEILEDTGHAVIVDICNTPDQIVQFITKELNL
jgi:gluconokinase